MAGWAVISLCYSIADHAAAMLDIDEYEGEDDGAFEYEVWNTDFFASMAFAGEILLWMKGMREKGGSSGTGILIQ